MPDPSPSAPRICFLLALWGKDYIRTFCEFSLASLLADGNIPALAREFECTFTLLARREDIPVFERQPLFSLLKKYCRIEYVDIEDTLFKGNHSATLTVALEKGMRAQGDGMLDTYFIYLMGDYLFGSTALSGLIPHIRNGASAITAGNYQVVEEEVLTELRQMTNATTGILDVPNRELVAWSFRHLNPVTIANTVNEPLTHMRHVNRLFWRIDADTMIGRFYLRHTLCLRPERTDYVLGASWDYSFLSEMCPSGKTVHLSDSDEYFVLELQPLLHEGQLIASGPVTPEFAARSLGEWTTVEQRKNAHYPVVYHTGNIPPATQAAIGESEQFVCRLEKLMPPRPLPARGHFYWLDCIRWLTADLALKPEAYPQSISGLKNSLWESKVFSPPLKAAGLAIGKFPPMEERENVSEPPREKRNRKMLKWLYAFYLGVFGSIPNVRLWHPYYFDYRLLANALKGKPPDSVLLVLAPTRQQWMAWTTVPDHLIRTPLLAERDPDELREELKNVKACIIHLPEKYDCVLGNLFNVLSASLPQGSEIHIFAARSMLRPQPFRPDRLLLRYVHLGSRPHIRPVAQNWFSGAVRRHMDKGFSRAGTRFFLCLAGKPVSAMWHALQLGLWHALYFIYNLGNFFHSAQTKPAGDAVCSAIFTYKVDRS